MDFGKVLQIATKNRETSNNEGKYYRTKFAPPKKETKESKQLSENVKKFLQKQKEEEQKKELEEKRKLANLLALRDEKSKNKIKKMLKVTKSANRSVLDDAIDNNNTAVTIEGSEIPDQDDYGYVSNEANAFYQRYIEKVKDVKDDKGFAPSRPQSLKDLTGTKERVKAAIVREKEEKTSGAKQRNRTSHMDTTKTSKSSSSSNSKTLYDPEAEKREEAARQREEIRKRIINRKKTIPPLDFHELLKLAEQKQHEEIVIVEVKSREPTRLLTAKEKREEEEEKKYQEGRRKREAEALRTMANSRGDPNDRIPKLNQNNNKNNPKQISSSSSSSSSNKKIIPTKSSNISNTSQNTSSKNKIIDKPPNKNPTKSAVKSNSNSALAINNKPTSSSTQNDRNKILSTKASTSTVREFPPRDTKLPAIKPREFPPSDVRKQRPEESRKKPIKRRIIDDDDEYDSEMDDFIDDGDAEMDYSSHIKEIFGYDRSR